MNQTFGSLFKKEIRSAWLVITIGILISLGMGLVLVLTFDTIKSIVSPNIALQMSDFGLVAWGNWFPKNYQQLMFILAVIIGMNKIALERGRNTLQFILVQPVSRETVYLTKFFCGLAHLLFIASVSTAGYYLILLFSGRQLSPIAQFPSFLISFLMGIPALIWYFALAMFISVFFRDRLLAGLTAFILGLALSVGSFIPALTVWSPFYYLGAMPVYLNEGFPWPAMIILLLTSCGWVYGGIKKFQRLQV